MTRKPTPTVRREKRLIRLLGGGIILAVGFLYLMYLNKTQHLLWEREVTTYASTRCQLISKKLDTKDYTAHKYRADFLISYTVNGVYYRKWVSGNGLDTSYFSEADAQEDILSRYQVGKLYQCSYYPNDPERVILVPRHAWGSLVPVVMVLVLMIGVCCYLLQHLIIYSHITRRRHQRKR